MVWIDLQNQRDNCYGGYGPGLYFYVMAPDIERFVEELQVELDAFGDIRYWGIKKSGRGNVLLFDFAKSIQSCLFGWTLLNSAVTNLFYKEFLICYYSI